MRTMILAGKIGPAFRTRTETDGVASVSFADGPAYTQHYVAGERKMHEVRSTCVELLFSCGDQDGALEMSIYNTRVCYYCNQATIGRDDSESPFPHECAPLGDLRRH